MNTTCVDLVNLIVYSINRLIYRQPHRYNMCYVNFIIDLLMMPDLKNATAQAERMDGSIVGTHVLKSAG